MEYNQWVQMQQNPNPNSDLSTGHAANHSHNPVSDHYQPPAFDPNNALSQPQPPGVDPPYVPTQYVQQPETVNYTQPPGTVNYALPPATVNYAQNVDAATGAAYYYPDPNLDWAAAYYGAVRFSLYHSLPGKKFLFFAL